MNRVKLKTIIHFLIANLSSSKKVSATGLPAGLAITGGGLISGTPTTAGANTVTATVSDGRGGTDVETFSWTIAAANVAPVLSNPGAQGGTVGGAASLQLVASDADGDVLSYGATRLPAGLVLYAGTGLISGTPTAAGTSSVTVTASDGRGGTDSETFSWVILAANVAPVVSNPGSQGGTVGVAVSLQVVATDGNATR